MNLPRWVLAAALLLAGCAEAEPTPTAALPQPAPQTATAAPGRTPVQPPQVDATPAPAPTATGAERPQLRLTPCSLAVPGASGQRDAMCGTLAVYEDRAAQAGRQSDLFVAVIAATGPVPAPDPLFFLAGGPGQAASQAFPSMAPAFEANNRERDIVLVDQRGTGQSNPLDCPSGAAQLGLDSPAELAVLADACVAGLDADPRYYTTSLAVDDLDDVREALGYQQLNLYGVSYGTRAALTYLRQHPERVRAVILDGVVPQDELLGLNVARNAQRALDQIFERCAAEAACRQAFPNLPDQFEAVGQRLMDEPEPLRIQHPLRAEPAGLDLTYNVFASAVRLLSYTPEGAAMLPLLIHRAHAGEDMRLLGVQALLLGEHLAESISQGMSTSVLCSEDAPFITLAAAERANRGTYLGSSQTDALMAVCARWPRGEVPPGFKQPVASPVPALLLSGQADPVTPPENAERAARSLPGSLHIVAPGQGHGVIGRGCLPAVAAEFIAAGSALGLDSACVGELGPAPFVTDL
jgi:pimeloyl-ACP methyl ester carboxylesterase